MLMQNNEGSKRPYSPKLALIVRESLSHSGYSMTIEIRCGTHGALGRDFSDVLGMGNGEWGVGYMNERGDSFFV